MRRDYLAILPGILVCWSMFVIGCSKEEPEAGSAVAAVEEQPVEADVDKGSSEGLPPLEIDTDEPLLLLEEPTQADMASSQPEADNHSCFVCHANYMDEPLATTHARENVGCVECHGESHAHRNDENNTTPPDIMYPAGRIDAACRRCHETHNAEAVAVIARWQRNCKEKTDMKSIVCTDCHGRHRLKLRTVRWDKETGKVISTNRGDVERR